MSQRYNTKSFWAAAAVSLVSCMFDRKPVQDERIGTAQTRQAGKFSVSKSMNDEPAVKAMSPRSVMRTGTAAVDAGVARGEGEAGAPAVRGGSKVDAGTRAVNVMANAAVGGSVSAGSSAQTASAGAAAGAHAGSTIDAGGNGQDAGRVAKRAGIDSGTPSRCPWYPNEQDESFCYDFESGEVGPNAGITYDLWPTPELPRAGQLATIEQPDMTHNHLLRTLPSLSGSETSAAVSHSTSHFDRATVEFDIWVNAALIDASDAVSFFRFVPIDGEYTQVTAIYLRRGEAMLRSESSATEYTLSRLPRTDQATHVSVKLVRSGACTVEVRFDAELVARAPAGPCAREANSFVEFGLDMLDRASGPMTAYYDNVSFTRQ